MKKLVLISLCLFCAPVFAQEPDNSPLTTLEGRLVLQKLYELKARQTEINALQDYINRDKELDQKQIELHEQELNIEKSKTKLADKQANLEKERADLYEQLYKSVTKKPGFGCKLYRVITFGLGKCQ